MAEMTQDDLMVGRIGGLDAMESKYLAFVVDGDHYAVEVGHIKEIIGMGSVVSITVVPQTENYIKGIINLRGDIVPVIDVRSRFMKTEMEYNQMTCIVVVIYQDYTLGLIVDSILGIYNFRDEMIAAPPSSKLNYANQFVKNIGRADDGTKLLLDLEKLIF